jgi:hypothetical protein
MQKTTFALFCYAGIINVRGDMLYNMILNNASSNQFRTQIKVCVVKKHRALFCQGEMNVRACRK